MPKRQSVRRIVSTEMQGEDSWIELASPKMEEMKAYRANLAPIQERIEQLQKEGVKDTDKRLVKAREELNVEGEKLISNYVKAWNWVDDDGNPLPPPSEEGAVNKLTMSEIKWITEQFDFGQKEKKA